MHLWVPHISHTPHAPGVVRGQDLGLRVFCHILTLLPPGASVFHKHMSSYISYCLAFSKLEKTGWIFELRLKFSIFDGILKVTFTCRQCGTQRCSVFSWNSFVGEI